MKYILIILSCLFICSCNKQGSYQTMYHLKTTNPKDFQKICSTSQIKKKFEKGIGTISVKPQGSFINEKESSYITSIEIKYQGRLSDIDEKVESLILAFKNNLKEQDLLKGFQIGEGINSFE